jgi:nickel-type superoxide dismutase maturation protease
MLPTLAPGDWLIADRHAYQWHGPRSGDIVLAADPRRPDRVLVKRVTSVDSYGGVFIEGDNPEATDSRHFGPIGRQAIHARVRWRYSPLATAGRVR